MEAMTLEREWLASYLDDGGWHDEAANVRNGIDLESYETDLRLIDWLRRHTHLAQPTQAVDVGAKLLHLMLERGCSKESQTHICTLLGLVEYPRNIHPRDADDAVAYFSRALSGEKAGPVGDGMPNENWFADQLCDLRNRWGEHEPSWLETDDNHPDDWMAKELRKRLLALPASPTPDKEG